MDNLEALKPFDSNSLEVFIDQKRFILSLSESVSQYLIKWFLTVVRQDVNSLDSSVVVHELEFAMKRDLDPILIYVSL